MSAIYWFIEAEKASEGDYRLRMGAGEGLPLGNAGALTISSTARTVAAFNTMV
jgi:hypothetical protein